MSSMITSAPPSGSGVACTSITVSGGPNSSTDDRDSRARRAPAARARRPPRARGRRRAPTPPKLRAAALRVRTCAALRRRAPRRPAGCRARSGRRPTSARQRSSVGTSVIELRASSSCVRPCVAAAAHEAISAPSERSARSVGGPAPPRRRTRHLAGAVLAPPVSVGTLVLGHPPGDDEAHPLADVDRVVADPLVEPGDDRQLHGHLQVDPARRRGSRRSPARTASADRRGTSPCRRSPPPSRRRSRRTTRSPRRTAAGPARPCGR